MTVDEQAAVTKIKGSIAFQWNWLTDDEIEDCYKYALTDYLSIRYPSQNNRPTEETMTYDTVCLQWISKRMRDILGRAGGLSASSYRENGINISYGASYIDPQLVALITPRAGIPR